MSGKIFKEKKELPSALDDEFEVEEVEYNQLPPLPVDQVYVVEVADAQKVVSKFPNADGSQKIDILWSFKVVEPEEGAGRKLSYFTPSTPKLNKLTRNPNKLLKFYNVCKPDSPLAVGMNFKAADLLGKRFQVYLENVKTAEGSDWQKISVLIPLKREGGGNGKKIEIPLQEEVEEGTEREGLPPDPSDLIKSEEIPF